MIPTPDFEGASIIANFNTRNYFFPNIYMKKVITTILFFCSVASVFAQNKPFVYSQDLCGDVASMAEIINDARISLGEEVLTEIGRTDYTFENHRISSKTENEKTWLYEYQFDGDILRKIDRKLSDGRGTETTISGKFEYDEQGRITKYYEEKSGTAKKGNLSMEVNGTGDIKKYIYEPGTTTVYSSVQGHETKEIWTNNGHTCKVLPQPSGLQTTLSYNDKGLIMKESMKFQTTTYSYNEKGLVISKTETIGAPGNTSVKKYTYKYEYDEQGNWISQKEYLNGVINSVILRTFEYR